ncbi:PRD domain-containing protein [Halobacillus sp. Marseille-P3879]|uniref:BglG family transcription antiterminator n=1 Tax=Halobacillus sp. Marseille-P3879 TaxID=2045014 RepID=UPI000C7AAF08|nr:PRD domain-containing protein [Halobacillus sp. Marseille-P3879]
MKPRQSQLLQILKEAEGDYVYGNYLSDQLEVSLRTIRNDVKEINEVVLKDALIESNNRFGYRLTGTLGEMKASSYQNFEERAFFIVKTLIEAKDYTVYANLADQIYYSARTIRLDVQKLSKICGQDFRGLEIQAKPFYGIKLIGQELEKRALLEEMIQKENHSEREIIHNAFLMFREWYSKEELEQILNIIKSTLRNSSLTISLKVLDQLFIHLLINVRRVKNGCLVNVDSLGNHLLPLQEKELSLHILENIGLNFNITFPKEEITYFAVFLISKKVCNRETHINQKSNEKNKTMMNAMKQALLRIEKQFGHPLLTDDQLLMGLYYHVERSIYPLKYSMQIDNPFIEKIKKKYLQSYYMGVFFAQEMERTICVSIDENEIGFIALHIQAALERIDKKTHVMELAVVCSSGIATSSLLKQKIEKSLPEIKVQGIYSTTNTELIPENVNLVVSTVPIDISQKKVLLVEEFLEEKDLDLIKKQCTLIYSRK